MGIFRDFLGLDEPVPAFVRVRHRGDPKTFLLDPMLGGKFDHIRMPDGSTRCEGGWPTARATVKERIKGEKGRGGGNRRGHGGGRRRGEVGGNIAPPEGWDRQRYLAGGLVIGHGPPGGGHDGGPVGGPGGGPDGGPGGGPDGGPGGGPDGGPGGGPHDDGPAGEHRGPPGGEPPGGHHGGPGGGPPGGQRGRPGHRHRGPPAGRYDEPHEEQHGGPAEHDSDTASNLSASDDGHGPRHGDGPGPGPGPEPPEYDDDERHRRRELQFRVRGRGRPEAGGGDGGPRMQFPGPERMAPPGVAPMLPPDARRRSGARVHSVHGVGHRENTGETRHAHGHSGGGGENDKKKEKKETNNSRSARVPEGRDRDTWKEYGVGRIIGRGEEVKPPPIGRGSAMPSAPIAGQGTPAKLYRMAASPKLAVVPSPNERYESDGRGNGGHGKWHGGTGGSGRRLGLTPNGTDPFPVGIVLPRNATGLPPAGRSGSHSGSGGQVRFIPNGAGHAESRREHVGFMPMSASDIPAGIVLPRDTTGLPPAGRYDSHGGRLGLTVNGAGRDEPRRFMPMSASNIPARIVLPRDATGLPPGSGARGNGKQKKRSW